MSDDRSDGHHEVQDDERSARPAPRNPFAEEEQPQLGDEVPALIEGRRSAAIHGVVVGLIALVLVVGLCVAASFAFG